MIETDAAWLAGLLEGEGSFQLFAGKKLNIQIRLSMTDGDVVNRAAKLMGGNGKVHQHPRRGGRKDAYRFIVCGQRTKPILEAIRPYMGDRRGTRIDELLEALG